MQNQNCLAEKFKLEVFDINFNPIKLDLCITRIHVNKDLIVTHNDYLNFEINNRKFMSKTQNHIILLSLL